MSAGLLDRVRELLDQGCRELDDPAARETLAASRRRLDEPLRVAIAGRLKAGKSTLLNALVGEELAPTDAGECTRIVTWYRDGPTYQVLAHLTDGTTVQRPFHRVSGAIRIDLGRPAEEVGHLEVRVPSSRLRRHTLIDTPGIASLSTDVSLRTMAFLDTAEDRAPQTDAVLYLLRHMHGSDVRFLEAFHGDDLIGGTPINAVGVLLASRKDSRLTFVDDPTPAVGLTLGGTPCAVHLQASESSVTGDQKLVITADVIEIRAKQKLTLGAAQVEITASGPLTAAGKPIKLN